MYLIYGWDYLAYIIDIWGSWLRINGKSSQLGLHINLLCAHLTMIYIQSEITYHI